MVAKLVIFVIICISISPIVYLWVRGIDYMHKNHPNYKGEDFLDWDLSEEEKNDIT